MKRVLIATENLNCGGVEKCLIELLNNMNYEKHSIDLLLFNEIGTLLSEVNKNVNIKYIIPNKKYKNRFINKIYKSIKTRILRRYPKAINIELRNYKYEVEIAYMHGYTTKLVSSIKSNAKKIAWIHTDISKCEVAKSYKLDEVLYKFDDIVCVSYGVKESVDKLSSEISKRTKVIYNIIDKEKIERLAKDKINYEFKENTIIGVGRFYKVKGFDLLIKAHKLLLDDGIKNNLILVGYGDAEEEYKKIIKELNLGDTVDIVGFKENPYPYIYNSDIFVLSSDHEGLPTVICEAMTLGKPIVATKCSGAEELINKNRHGILCECGSEESIKEGIKKILTDNVIKEKLHQNNKERGEIFNNKKIINEIYLTLFNS